LEIFASNSQGLLLRLAKAWLELEGLTKYVLLRLEILQRAERVKATILTVHDEEGGWSIKVISQRNLYLRKRLRFDRRFSLLDRLEYRRTQRNHFTIVSTIVLEGRLHIRFLLLYFLRLVFDVKYVQGLGFLEFGRATYFLCRFDLRLR